MARNYMFTKSARRRAIKRTKILQLRKYPENWVSDVVESNESEFDLGINYFECAICKFYKKQGAKKYVPYLCLLDYASYRAFGIEMKRTKTMGNGRNICNFRFSKDYETPRGCPPEKLEEFNVNIIKSN